MTCSPDLRPEKGEARAIIMEKSISDQSPGTILALDIGGGTQDLLLWDGKGPLENSVQGILPSPTVMVARKIEKATRKGKAIYLTGHLMGGGAVSMAIYNHIRAGLPVYTQEKPALTLNDSLEKVKGMGIQVVEESPGGVVEIFMADVRIEALNSLFEAFEILPPDFFLVAVQDHGFSPQASNRRFRFQQWADFLNSNQPLENLLYRVVPPHLTRMQAIQEVWPQAIVLDTGAAAILGALEDEKVAALGAASKLIVNIGNEHTLAAWMVDGYLLGIYEQHTGLLSREKLLEDLNAFIRGELSNERVLQEGGHGCLNQAPRKANSPPIAVTGPRRGLLSGTQVLMAAPFGNMMLSGCFGLLRAFRFSNYG
jgi:uncharacterized protein (DUF1786 family)